MDIEVTIDCRTGAQTVATKPNPPASQPSEQQIIADLVNAVQGHLDAVARTRYYDGILSLCTYVTSTDSTFSNEGQAGVEWRDACWRTCYQVLADCKAGLRTPPTPEELLAELPTINW